MPLKTAKDMLLGPKISSQADLKVNRGRYLEQAKKDPRWKEQANYFESWQISPGEIIAHVSEGRWCGDCPNCNSGMALIPGVQETACYDCGRIYSLIHFPSELDQIEAVLLVRPVDNRNWHPPETLDNLVAENLAHDLPRGF